MSAAPPPPGILTDPHSPLQFTFEGRPVVALSGQSIAAALYAAGVRTFSRSFKYHRPRGLFCVAGECPNCLMNVDGRPNVRTCLEPARPGQVVRRQNAWPSADFDVLRVFDKLAYFLPVGFYYKRFHKPRWLWPVFEHAVRHVAGRGRIDRHARPATASEVRHLHADVCVIGGGPAGLAAAAAAQATGVDVLLLERSAKLGGHLLYEGHSGAVLNELLAAVGASPRGLRVLRDTAAFGLYEGNLVGAFQGEDLIKVRAREILIATGGRQQPFLFANNDLPGIFLGRGVQRLARLHGVRAGRRAVVLTDCDDGQRLAADLAEVGIEVVAVVDHRPGPRAGADWPTLGGHAVLKALGDAHLEAVRVAPLSANGRVDETAAAELACDLLCLAGALTPANELLLQAGVGFRHGDGGWRLDRTVPGVLAAGAAAGTYDVDAQIREGRHRGQEAAARVLGSDFTPSVASEPRRGPAYAPPPASVTAGKCFVCLCEDVTVKDLYQAVAEGFDHAETLKRYSTVSMGPCQGKVCGLAASAVCARATGRDIGTTTSRPPAVPVELGTLAAGQRHQPVRRTPLHHWHQAAGARWMDAGQWKRPESYGDPAAEVQAVRTVVGLIDVSTLGKIELIGPGAAELLERVYLNKWSDLNEGRARYAAMCTEEGILFDDGVGVRLGPQHFYLTATTGNAEAVWQWLELWRTTWGLDVILINRTAANAALNLAGPRAREVLAPLTPLDLSPAACPYLAARDGEVAGVSCRLLRLGFVGELGYEIHCPSAHAWHLWEALFAAGAPFGLKPFGVEAQRILRLEKGHVLIGQDTDALSNPLDAGLEGLVRFDKPYFHGRDPLQRLRAMPPRSRLVGFFMVDRNLVPPEGSQVVADGRPVGRVTSARFSPTLGRSLGLAWVPAAAAQAGQRFLVRHNGADVPAEVSGLPFYDPEGLRLKS
jgi:sarcosine oxidase subunit alpha